ncbi:Ig-like domain-containing protein [Exiguobacterium alkaliphilum]|uniref:Ig-like domain-containing protein n=1 Tax=Exiguobacterium alkaliphilum TaxID=1428684 RepID=A0ABT2KWK0_9BACL|nr:Ig-like domain-containing protein [Exiguobacterium alkaliphilum]MCT4794804.1 Ig-like domain-containing protein [Exiguobacterium alkaliphilum]
MAKKKQFVTAAAAFAVAASAVTPAITADAATKTVRLSSDFVRAGNLDAALDKSYNGGEIHWYKSSVDMNKLGVFQTAKGFVKGQGLKVEKRVRVLNYAQDIQPEGEIVLEQGVPASGLRVQPVLFADGNHYAKPVAVAGFNTDKVGEFEGTFTYANKAFGTVTKTVKYKVVASKVELSNVKQEVEGDTLSVSADVKNLKDGEKVELVIFPGKDESKAIAIDAVVKEGVVTASAKDLPVGNHSFILRSGEVKTDAVNFAVEAPMVKEVKAINAQTVEVHFNKAIDAKTLKVDNEDLIKVEAGSGAVETGAIKQELSTDGMTLTLTTANTKIFKGDYTVKVPFEMIKDVKGTFVKPINAKVSVDDKVAPALVKATTLVKDVKDGIKSVVVTFDENVKSVDTIKIDGLNYNVVLDGKEATITFAQPLDASKKYDVTVINATDFAGNIKDVQVAPLSVSVDNVSPEVSSVVAISEDKLKLTLSKKVDIAELKKSSMLSATVGTFATSIIESVDAGEKDGEYIITLNDQYLFKTGNSDVVTLKFAEKALVDSLGNTNLVKIEKTATVTKDATAPAVSKVEEVKDKDGKVTGFALTYTEDVKGQSLTGLKVVNAKGEILAVNDVVNAPTIDEEDSKKVVFSFKANVVSSKYTFELPEGFVTDNALVANKSAKYGFSVTINDIVPPAQTSFAIVSATNVENKVNTLAVDFGTKVAVVGDGSALNPSAYTINGVTLPADTKITLAGNVGDNDYQTKVEIELPKGFVKANDAKAGFRITGVKSLDGKTSESKFVTVDIKDNTAPELKSIVATDLTKLTLSYSEAVKVTAEAPVAPATKVDAIADELKLLDSKGNVVTFSDYTVTEDGKIVLTVTDAIAVKSVSTVKLGENGEANIFDANNVAQKEEITVSK